MTPDKRGKAATEIKNALLPKRVSPGEIGEIQPQSQ
jgi:hypothetical protein